MPQWSVNKISDMIANGKIELALVAGGEALYTQNAQRNNIILDWTEKNHNKPY